MVQLGKILVVLGAFLVASGLLFIFGARVPFLGKLPGDILIKKENFTFYFPLTTSILLSVVLSLLFRIFRHK